MKKYLAHTIIGIGGLFTGILLVPMGVLAISIYSIWLLIDRLVRWCDKR